MAQEERYHTRDLAYNSWHREQSTKRFIPNPRDIPMIDIDAVMFIEYDDGTKEPVALVETAQDVGQSNKPCTILKALARISNLRAFCVLYTLSDKSNPADPRYSDLEKLRVKQIAPYEMPDWMTFTPEQWAKYLATMRWHK